MARLCVCVIILLTLCLQVGEVVSAPLKKRSQGGKVLSWAAQRVDFLTERAYQQVSDWRPFILGASISHGVPAEVLASILFQESVHRKPVDFNTFGPCQIGYGELRIQKLPLRRDLLEDPELCIWILGRKLSRLKEKTGSLDMAISLHNGYSDYLGQVKKRMRDPTLHTLLFVETIRPSFWV